MTAIVAHLAGSVQTDIKSALSFASLVQVGIIVTEIGLGLRYVPLIHLLGHACLRTLQFIRAPTLLQDYRTLENAIGEHLPHGQTGIERYRIWLYRWSLERGYLDSLLSEYFVFPFVRAFRWCDGMERRWTDFLSHGPSRDSDQVRSPSGGIDELA
jgi:NAD(P)H-quinone oxidoreductase subunit 5